MKKTKKIAPTKANFCKMLDLMMACYAGREWFKAQKGTVRQILDRAGRAKRGSRASEYYDWLLDRHVVANANPYLYHANPYLYLMRDERKALPYVAAFGLPERREKRLKQRALLVW